MTGSERRLNQGKRGNCTVTYRGKEIETDVRRILHSLERELCAS